ncbi:MAG: hypothetical protein IJ062_13235 [Firmicutes bacterium]|nr:hypothetical protein [Bacillota bacterium]
MTRIYNITAELCSEILALCTDDSLFLKYSCISSAAKALIHREISKTAPALFTHAKNGSLTVRRLENADLCSSFFDELDFLIQNFKSNTDIFSMIRLLQVIDESMENILLEKTLEYQSENFSIVLNTNRETTGVGLLPCCSCVWERKNHFLHSYNRLDNFLSNFLLMENAVLGELIDKHYFLRPDTFSDFEKRHSLNIAVTPLRLENHFVLEDYEENRVQYLQVRYFKEYFEQDNEQIWQKMLTAAKKNSDIVVFPELLGNPETEAYICAKLKALSESEQRKMPALTILPSFYSKKFNTAAIIDRFGNVICRQSKQNPYRIVRNGGSQLEAITANNVVNIFHYEGIGRIAVLICKDFLTTSHMEQLMRCFRLTLIIVPSYSTGSYDFRQSFDLCAHDDCNVVWINTCAALSLLPGKEANFENIGYVRKRIGRGDDDSQKLCNFPICGGAFGGQCTHDCIYFEKIQGV